MSLPIYWLDGAGDDLGRGEAFLDDAFEWREPAVDEVVLGFGVARDLTAAGARGLVALADAIARLDVDARGTVGHGGAIVVGAAPFDPERPGGGAFGPEAAARWVLPQVAVVSREGRCRWAIAGAKDRPAAEAVRGTWLRRLRTRPAAQGGPPRRIVVEPEEAPAAFRARVRDALVAIARGELQKVVLARACALRADAPFDPARLWERLASAEPAAVRYALPLPRGRLVGATPERLVRVQGGRVGAHAIAGSAARGNGPAADRRCADALRESKKDQEEHAFVRAAVAEALSPRVDRLEAPESPGVLSTGRLHHLHTPFEGAAREGEGVLGLANALHPTPAVGGVPAAPAAHWLRAREPLARGAYAGPFGWVDLAGEGALAVALRGALLCGNEATVFAGAGVVAGSEPEAELAETRLKMRTLLDALLEV